MKILLVENDDLIAEHSLEFLRDKAPKSTVLRAATILEANRLWKRDDMLIVEPIVRTGVASLDHEAGYRWLEGIFADNPDAAARTIICTTTGPECYPEAEALQRKYPNLTFVIKGLQGFERLETEVLRIKSEMEVDGLVS